MWVERRSPGTFAISRTSPAGPRFAPLENALPLYRGHRFVSEKKRQNLGKEFYIGFTFR